MVPLIAAEDGKWLVPQGLNPLLKPGGHGAIWKLMQDEGVFDWLYQHDREAAIVRQIRSAYTLVKTKYTYIVVARNIGSLQIVLSSRYLRM